MGKRQIMIKAALALTLVWGCVWGVRAAAGAQKITAERINRVVEEARFADWSQDPGAPDSALSQKRESDLRAIAGLVNRLDFQEREKNRQNRTGEAFFRKLSPSEKSLFIDLTVVESMSRFMDALDAMKPEQRKRFVEQGLKEIEAGRTQSDLAQVETLDPQLLDKITQQGMKAYFEKSTADTKLDLAPLMDAMNGAMQGLRGNEFGPR
jgi:hypothetical protein